MYQHIYYYYITGTMSDEQPLLLKKLKKVVANEGECICICHYPHQIHDIEVRPLNDHTFAGSVLEHEHGLLFTTRNSVFSISKQLLQVSDVCWPTTLFPCQQVISFW